MDQGDGHGRAAPERAEGQGGRRADRGGRARAARAHAPRGARARFISSVDVPVALLGYGTVGSAVNRLLVESAGDIERATGHRLRVVRALVRDTDKERDYPAGDGVLTTDFQSVLEDDSIALVAEVMGGFE